MERRNFQLTALVLQDMETPARTGPTETLINPIIVCMHAQHSRNTLAHIFVVAGAV
jgi:hypothetical protein